MAVIRALRSPVPSDRGQQLGTMLQFLLAHGDEEFVEELIRMTQHRVDWVLHRDFPDPTVSRRKP